MFRECLEMASVDAVLNLVNIRPQRRVTVEAQPEQPAPEVVDTQKAPEAAPAEEEKKAE